MDIRVADRLYDKGGRVGLYWMGFRSMQFARILIGARTKIYAAGPLRIFIRKAKI